MHEQEPARKTPVGIYLLIGCGVLAGGFVVLSILAGLLVPTLLRGRGEAGKVMCKSNLRMIATQSMVYAAESGSGRFPHSPEGGIASLQLLVDALPELNPRTFVCPSAKDHSVATIDPRGRFRLTPETCSYELVPVKLRPTDGGYILAYDSAPHHGGGRNVVYTDAAVEFLSEAKFQEELARARARAAAGDRAAPGKK